jgi:hypothetical protein
MEGTSNHASADTKPPPDYTSEPEIFGVRYNNVSMMLYWSFPVDSLANDTVQLVGLYDAGRLDECRKGCLDLLAEPELALFTRVQTLQLAASVSQPALTYAHLKEAASLLEQPDADMWQVILLKSDNDKEFATLESWIGVNGMVGLPLEMLRRGDLIGLHGRGCLCDEVAKIDEARYMCASAAKEDK